MNYRNSTRPAGRRLARAAARLFAPCLLIVLICGTAAAYTVVMRGGRRVEIPGEFELTRTMLIYEAAPGVSVTLPLDLVDVEATERVNGEPAGGFLRRARGDEGRAATRRTPLAAAAPRPAPRTFTNRDLEAVRRARVESERDYERRRVELGLPSAEEMRLHNEREEASMRELARRKAEEDAEAERDRRARRDELQIEMSLLGDEGYYARRSIELSGDTSGYFSPGVLGVVTTGRLFGGGRFYGPRRRALPYRPSYPAGAFGAYGARHRPRLRRGVGAGAGAGFDVNGGTRAVIGFGRRSLRVRPAGRR